MSAEQIARMIELSQTPRKRGKWSDFCKREGLTKDTVNYQRRKLGLMQDRPKAQTEIPTVRVHDRLGGHGATDLVVVVGPLFYGHQWEEAEKLAAFVQSAIAAFKGVRP